MEMSVTDMLPLFTNKIVMKYSDNQKAKSFGRSLFPEEATTSKLASIMSQRGIKLTASDVERGSRGNLNVFDKFTQENILPPYFNEYINLTEMDSYDYLHSEGVSASKVWGMFIQELSQKMEYIINKIDTAYELQCWQCLENGIVTLNNGTNVTYGRKAGSLVNLGAGNYFTDAIDPYTTAFDRGAVWLNETGKMVGNTINVVFGKGAWAAYQANAAVVARNLNVNNNLEVLSNKALVDSTGKIFKGATTVGAFNYLFWLYEDFYETNGGATKNKFVNSKKIIMIPDELPTKLVYTAVPQRIKFGSTPVASKFTTWHAVDEFQDAEFTGVKSAGIPVVGGKDQIYTEQVIA